MVDSARDAALPRRRRPALRHAPRADGGCDAQKGPFTVAAGDGVRAIDVFANADSPLNDIVLKLFSGTTLVAEADTITTPERIRYAPAGGVPAGDYFVQVCDFGDGAARGRSRAPTPAPSARQQPRRRRPTSRAGRLPGQPAAQPAASDPWDNPTPTRA